MSVDPTRNVVVFQLGPGGDSAIAEAATLADDCVRQAWDTVRQARSTEARDVTALYSEWEPSASDQRFLAETFPSARLTYSFSRPDEAGWPAAFDAARRAMEDAVHARTVEHTRSEGELLPILWSPTDMLEALPHRTLVPGHLHLALAWVAPTPHGTIGMDHLTHHTLQQLGDPALDDLGDLAMENLRDGLHIDGEESRLGILLSLHRPGSIAAGAVALGDFHQQMSRHVGDDRLLVGLLCQELVLVTAAGSALASHVLETVANSPHAEGELAPMALLLDAGGLRPATGP